MISLSPSSQKLFPMISFFSCFFFLLSLCTHVSSAADTISATFSLSGDQTIISSGRVFELGFYKLGTTSSSSFYIGMWYKQLSEQTVVWIANRNKPVSDKNTSILKISDGNLVLLEGKNQTPVWSTGLNSTPSSPASSSLEAVLLDDGNLVLRDSSLATVLWQSFDHPGNTCEVYAYCGAFGICNYKSQPFCQCLPGFSPASQKDWDLNDYSSGCVRNTDLQCSRGDINEFLPLPNIKLDENVEELTRTSHSICQSACQGNCSCNAYAHEEGSNRCLIWSKDVLNLHQLEEDNSEGNTFYLRLAASDMPNDSLSNSNKVKKIFGLVLGSLGVIVSLLLLVVLILRYRRREKSEGTLSAFSYRELQNATKNFSEKLGGGGFGSVFKGLLPDSSEVAVKRLESISQGEKQFRTEVVTIGTIQHVNLVRLRGFCSEGNKKMLVYDYMPNGSLDSHLFEEQKIVLSWKLRYQIALGTARGLAYLHEECRDCIIHCDIKPENILLDSQFCPKVADFGLAKLMGRDFSRVLTTMRGTRGYLAPEWISGVAVTAKADVYSYGMMLFELVSGRRNSNGNVRFFPSWVATVLINDGGDISSLLDPRLEEEDDVDIEEEVTRACKVACWCIQDEESHRPTMSQVVKILVGVLEVNTPPFPRSIRALVDTDEDVIFFTESSSSSSHSSSQKQSNSSTNNNSLG